jgi:hypothetical protein
VTAADFTAWVAHMKATRNWSARRCSRELGCGVNQIGRWSEAGAPPYIALACAALAYGLPPWQAL